MAQRAHWQLHYSGDAEFQAWQRDEPEEFQEWERNRDTKTPRGTPNREVVLDRPNWQRKHDLAIVQMSLCGAAAVALAVVGLTALCVVCGGCGKEYGTESQWDEMHAVAGDHDSETDEEMEQGNARLMAGI